MRDPRVFGPSEESPSDDGQDGQPVPGPEMLLGKDDNTQYGYILKDIQRSDLAKCSFQGLRPSTHFSQSMPLRRLSLELKHFLTDHPSYISVAPIEDNLVRLSYLHPERHYLKSSLI
jgi:hypothetical protein